MKVNPAPLDFIANIAYTILRSLGRTRRVAGQERKSPPFAVTRSIRLTLVEQVLDGLRSAITGGYYKPGDALPGTRDLAKALGVSTIVTEAVIKKLGEEGLIVSRPRIGSVVVEKGEKLWKGHFLLVMRGEYGTYYSNVLIGVIREEMIKAGYLVSTVATPFGKNGKPDTAALSAALRQSVDLAILIFDNPTIERCIAESGVKFVLVGDRPSKAKTSVGSITYRRDAAAQEFAPLLKKQGVRTLMEVGTGDVVDAKELSVAAGLRYSFWAIPVEKGVLQPEGTEIAAMETFVKRLRKGRAWLPDAFYFSDDYIGAGAIKALMTAGVRIPDDVRVITWSNRGNGPVFSFPVAYAQMDPYADGADVSRMVREALSDKCGTWYLKSRFVDQTKEGLWG